MIKELKYNSRTIGADSKEVGELVKSWYESFCKGEIGADVFAMQAILEIVKNIPNFDYKLFFESYAKNNFYKTTENVIEYLHEKDTHPPYYLRVNITVQQFDEFYKTFNIKRKDGMFLKKEDRIEF